jgi:branched-chain amino acid transport system permease protein
VEEGAGGHDGGQRGQHQQLELEALALEPGRQGGAGAVLVLLALVPLVVPANVADMLTRVLAFALLAIGLDLLTGVAGLPSLGQAVPFGAGAYTAALLGKHVTTVGPVQLAAAAVAGGPAGGRGGLAAGPPGAPTS